MRINIDLKSDKQFRKEVREMIAGQVTAIVRDEIKQIIMEVVGEKESKLTPDRLNQLLVSEVARCVNSEVNNGWSNDHQKLKNIIRQEIAKHLEGMREQIGTLISAAIITVAKEELSSTLEKEIEKGVKRHITSLLIKS